MTRLHEMCATRLCGDMATSNFNIRVALANVPELASVQFQRPQLLVVGPFGPPGTGPL